MIAARHCLALIAGWLALSVPSGRCLAEQLPPPRAAGERAAGEPAARPWAEQLPPAAERAAEQPALRARAEQPSPAARSGVLAPPAPERARIGIYGGAGYANEHASDGMYGAGALRVTGFFPAQLTGELLLETLSQYDRTYSTRLPAPDGDGLLRVPVSERLPRGRLQLGYELLALWPAARERGRLAPFACGELMAFVNDVWPQRVLSFGGGLAGELRLHEGLRLMFSFSYLRAAHFAAASLSRSLLFGPLTGSVRMQFGAAFAIHPRARFELHYQGELLQYEHTTRVLDTLLFGPVFHVR